jgi:hypothetical protein
LYFSDVVNSSPEATQTVAQVSLDGATSAHALFQYASAKASLYGISFAIGSQLILNSFVPNQGETLSTLSVGVPSSPTPIASFPNPTGGLVQSDDIFVSEFGLTGSGATLAPVFFTTALKPDGTVLQARTANSYYLVGSSAGVLQISGATGPSGVGGGSVSLIGSGVKSSTIINDATGAPFRFASDIVYAFGFNLTSTIGFVSAESDTDSLTYLYDLSKSLMVPVTVPDSDVQVVRIF